MDIDEYELKQRWAQLRIQLQKRFAKKPDLESILFLIGIQETGFLQQAFSKEEKQDLMHVGVCSVLSNGGYYAYAYTDEDGWLHFDETQPLPVLTLQEQEYFLKAHIVTYFSAYDFL